jgi:hypothetical protein
MINQSGPDQACKAGFCVPRIIFALLASPALPGCCVPRTIFPSGICQVRSLAAVNKSTSELTTVPRSGDLDLTGANLLQTETSSRRCYHLPLTSEIRELQSYWSWCKRMRQGHLLS